MICASIFCEISLIFSMLYPVPFSLFSALEIVMIKEDDPEIPDRYIVLRPRVRLTLPEAMAANSKWNEGWMQIFPYPRTCVFRLSVDLT